MAVRAIHQILPTILSGDAIGNHVLELRRLFRGWGYASEIFAQQWQPGLSTQVQPYLSYTRLSHPDNLLILHFSIGGEVNRFVVGLPDRLILYYHNITPAHFFAPYDAQIALSLDEARRDLASFAGQVPAIAASNFNARELQALGFQVVGVVPYVFALQQHPNHIDGGNAVQLRQRFEVSGSTDWLHVGRLAPNKCIHDIIKSFYYYHTWINPASRLLLVGNGAGLDRYVDRLKRLIAHLRLGQVVVFTGQVDQPAPFYRMAQVYVAMSEHEGFCVPLLEAMQQDLPIVGFAAAAVPETLGGAGVLIHRKDHPVIAEVVHEVVSNAALRAHLSAGQRVRLAAYEPEKARADLRACLDQVGRR